MSVRCSAIAQYFISTFSFPSESGQVLVTGLFSDAYSEMAREAAYRIYLHPEAKQDELLVNLLTSRHQLAEVCGFPTYAHRYKN